MPQDPLARIFGDPFAPISGIQGPKIPREDPLPHHEIDGKGYATPINFDNNKMITVYEENLKTLVDQAGMMHPGVDVTAEGLSTLYDLKAGVEKNISFYDKAIEYLQYANTSKEKVHGRGAKDLDRYKANEIKIAKIQRKKERRIAKSGAADAIEEAPLAIPAQRVAQVRCVTGGQLVFIYEDGTHSSFRRAGLNMTAGNKLANMASEMSSIDDDITERFSQPPFHLEEGEFLVGVITHEKQLKGELNALCFHTSSGRRSQWFEFKADEPRGREYSYWANKDCHIIGLEAKNGNIVVPLGLTEGHRGRTTS